MNAQTQVTLHAYIPPECADIAEYNPQTLADWGRVGFPVTTVAPAASELTPVTLIVGVLVAGLLVVMGALAWRVLGILSPDAIAMAVGLLFGIVAPWPVALLMLWKER